MLAKATSNGFRPKLRDNDAGGIVGGEFTQGAHMLSADKRMLRLGIATAVAGSVIGISTLIVAAQQYTATGSVPTSSIPPDTRPDTIALISGRPVIAVNNAMFGDFANVYEVQDQSPLATSEDFVAYSSPDTTSSLEFGPIPAGTVVQPLFVRGDRVFVYMPATDNYAWLARPRAVGISETATSE